MKAILPMPPIPEIGELPRRKFNRAEVDAISEAGLFAGQRLELIDGDLIDKMGQNPPHVWAVRVLMAMLADAFGAGRILCQSSMEVSFPDRERNLPEPDLAVLVAVTPEYRSRLARGDEMVLAVEVADSTSRADFTVKRDLYARAGVPEYWVLDINGRRLVVHRDPEGGVYRHVAAYAENESVAPQARPDRLLAVSAMLP